MRSAVFEISLLIGFFIVVWLATGWNALFYIALALIGLYVIIMTIYIVIKGPTTSWGDIILGIIALAVWLAIAWAMLREKGIHLWGL